MIAGYLVLVEAAKARFYAHEDRPQAVRPTQAERHRRHIRRRAARFARDGTVAAVGPARRSPSGHGDATRAPMSIRPRGGGEPLAGPRTIPERDRAKAAGDVGRQTRGGDEPGDHRVRVPHLARLELVASPHRRRHARDEVAQPACDPRIAGQSAGLADRRAEIRDGPSTPAADLVAEKAQRAERTGSRRRPWRPRLDAPRRHPARARPRSCSARRRAR